MQKLKRFSLAIFLKLISGFFLLGNNVQISNVSFTPMGNAGQITFDITWENSWRLGVNDEFHDAVWVFVKYAPNGGPQWLHADIQQTNNDPGIQVLEPNDLKGAFIRRATQGEGSVPVSSVTFDVNNNVGIYPDFKVFGIEMVYIPTGPYYLGDGTSNGRFHRGDNVNQPFQVTNSDVIKVGSLSTQLDALLNAPPIDIPAAFPNGFDAFYCMKYNVSQEQYIEFLHTLDRVQQNNHTETDISGTSISNVYVMFDATSNSGFRHGIKCSATLPTDVPVEFFCDLDDDGNGNESNDGQNIVMGYINIADFLAYLDWAALRPMTELEYEKACRGPLPPVADEMAWGSSGTTIFTFGQISGSGTSSESVSIAGTAHGIISSNSAATGFMRVGFTATPASSRTLSGAGYYGVLDLSGNGNEVTISTNSSGSLGYKGILGDGMLDPQGLSDEVDWMMKNNILRGTLSTSTNYQVSNRTVPNGLSTARNSSGFIRGVRQH